MDRIDKFLDELEKTFAYIREREGGDSVCGLCEYDGAYIGESGDWCNECPGFNKDDCFKLSAEIRKKWKAQVVPDINVGDIISRQAAIDALDCISGVEEVLKSLPSAQPEQKWIPCSETVDIPDHEVMACDRYGEFIIGYLDCKDEQWLCESDDSIMYDPVAWCELPKPYKEEGT